MNILSNCIWNNLKAKHQNKICSSISKIIINYTKNRSNKYNVIQSKHVL